MVPRRAQTVKPLEGAMLTITVKDSAFQDYLAQLQQRLEDLTEPMAEIGAVLESRISARFETETDPRGTAWAPWMPSTLESYPEDGNHRILDRYGDLMGSLNWQADASSVRVGFGQPYAIYHEFGTTKMARRGLLFDDPDAGTLDAGDEMVVLDVLEHWLGLT